MSNPSGHKCIQDSLWKRNETVRVVRQADAFRGSRPRRRGDAPQPIRIRVDASFMQESNAQARRYTCFKVGDLYIRGSAFMSPAPLCSMQTASQRERDEFCLLECTAEDVLTPEKKEYLLSRLMDEAVRYFRNALKVAAQDVVLLESTASAQCNARNIEVSIPGEYSKPTNADIVLFVTASPTHVISGGSGEEKNVGFARYCVQNEELRPIGGVINIGTNAIALDDMSHSFQVALVIHEITHALGFTRALLEQLTLLGRFKIESHSNAPYPSERKFVTTPNVLKAVQRHFNCSAVVGAQLEDGYGFGGSAGGTALSHWEKRLFMNEYMTGIGSGGISIKSNITLALLEDLGFYYPDYGVGETLKYGRSLGCGFATAGCASQTCHEPWADNPYREHQVFKTSYSPYHCTSTTENICTFDRTARGLCGTVLWSQVKPEFRYFAETERGGASQLADFCPYVRSYSNGDCLNPTKYNEKLAGTKAALKDFFGSKACASCRCFTGKLSKHRSLIDYGSYKSIQRADCFDSLCVRNVSDGLVHFLVGVGSSWSTCPRDGGRALGVSAELYDEFSCPTAWEMCSDDDVNRQMPKIERLAPNEGPIGGAALFTIIGDNFHSVGEWAVAVAGTRAPHTQYLSRTQMIVKSPRLKILPNVSTFLGDVAIRDAFGRGVSARNAYTFVREWPRIDAVRPSSGRLAGENVITIEGSFFTGKTSVWINDKASPDVVLVSSTRLHVVVPADATGMYKKTVVPLRVVTQPHDRTVFASDGYEYNPSFSEVISNFVENHWWIMPVVSLACLLLMCFGFNKFLLRRYGPIRNRHFQRLAS